jgi:prepilin-type processing-associated H-X9-DG protein
MLNNLALNVVFMDGHAKKIMGTQFRALRYDLNGGYTGGNGNGAPNTYPNNGMDLDWFLDQPGTNGNVNTDSSPANGSSDIG